MNDPDYQMVLPLALPLMHLKASYQTNRTEFLLVAHILIQNVIHESGRHWTLAGCIGDKMYLRLPCDGLGTWFPYLEEELRITDLPGSVTLSLLSRLPSVHEFFQAFTDQLDRFLPKTSG